MPGTDLEQFRRFVESKLDSVESQMRQLQDAQMDGQDDAAKWRARHEQGHAIQEHRVNLLDARVSTVEISAARSSDQLKEMEKFILGMSVDTLKTRLEKFAIDIEKAFGDVHQVEADLANHIGTISETYGQTQTQINIIKQTMDSHGSQMISLNSHVNAQLNLAADKVGGLEGRVTGMAASSGSAVGISPPGIPGSFLGQASLGGKCHCHHLDQLMMEMATAKSDIQNLGGLSGYVTVCQSLDARIKLMEDLMDKFKQPADAKPQDPMAGGNDTWNKYLQGAGGGAASPSLPGVLGASQVGQGYGGYGGGDGYSSWFPGGAGGPPGGGGGYPGGGGQWPRMPQNGGLNVWNIDKIFDDKVAMSNDHSYDGNANGEKWKIKVEGYWIGKLPALLEVIEWASKQDAKPITKVALETERQEAVSAGRWKPTLTDDILDRVNGIIWGFLNLCLKGEAHRMFLMADRLNGLEGWRRVTGSIYRGRENHQSQLRDKLRVPQKVHKLEDVEMGIINFETLIRDYIAVDGTPPNDLEKKSDIMHMMPAEVREGLLWHSTDRTHSYEEFRDHIKMQTNSILYHRGKLKSQINAVELPEAGDENGKAPSEDDQIELLAAAVYKRMGKGGGKG